MKLSAEQLRNLRMGIPIAAMAVSSATAQVAEKTAEPPSEDLKHKITQATLSPQAHDERTYIPDAEAFYNLNYDQDTQSVYYEAPENQQKLDIKDLDQRSAKEVARAEKSELRHLNRNMDQNQTVEYINVDLTEDHITEGMELGNCDEKARKIKMYTYKYDEEFIQKYVEKNIIASPANYQSVAEQMGKPHPSVEEINGFIIELLNESTSQTQSDRVFTHEQRHLEIAQKYGGRSGISPEQSASLNQTNEISANIAELLLQRDNYLKNGDINQISDDFKFYKDAIKNKEIVPGSQVKELEEKEFSLIMNGTQNYWLAEKQEMYMQLSIVKTAQDYIKLHKNEIRTLAPNEKELAKREKAFLTFNINGHRVNLEEFREGRPQVPEKYRQEIDSYYQEQCGGISPDQLDKIKKIKSQDDLDKLKIENCSKFDQQLRKNAALKILEKQGRRLAPKNLRKNEKNSGSTLDLTAQKQRNNTK